MNIARGLLLGLGLVVAACGSDTPGSPSPTMNLAGAWTGTWSFVAGGATVTDTVAMTLAQNGTTVSGQWSSAGNAAGTVSFTAGADFTGTVSFSQTLITGGNCSASTTMTGTASANQIQFTPGTLTSAGLCQWATNQQFTFAR